MPTKKITKSEVKKVESKKRNLLYETHILPKEDFEDVAVEKEYVILHHCVNCSHFPVSLDRLFHLLSFLVALLSIALLIHIGEMTVPEILDLLFYPIRVFVDSIL